MHPASPKSQSSLEAVYDLLQRFLDFLPDAVLVVDQNGNVIAWNRAIEKLTGIPGEDILGSANYRQAPLFHGQTKPSLIDVALKLKSGTFEGGTAKEPGEGNLQIESFVPELFGGRGGYIQATASPVFDSDGKLIGAIESIRDISESKRLESTLLEKQRSLREKSRQIEDINTAFRVLLKHREDDHNELEKSIMANLKESIQPHIEKLRKTALDRLQEDCLTAIQKSIGDVLSPFIKGISTKHGDLTPMELQIANLIKEGRSTKEIAEFFHVAEKTVSTHRYNLRIKLGFKNRKTNLRTYLLSLG
jgi:DNA-binding CsgD family transcriptional regulator